MYGVKVPSLKIVKCEKCGEEFTGYDWECICLSCVLNDVKNIIDKGEPIIDDTKKEAVNHPKHYNVGSIEVIDVIDDWKLGFNLGNAIKYIGRAEHKADKKEDLEKAIWYIERELKRL